MADPRERGFGIAGVDREVLRGELVGERRRLLVAAGDHDAGEPLEAVPREVGPFEHGELLGDRRGHPIGDGGARRQQDRRPRRVLGLGQHVGRDELRSGGLVGHDHDLARAGDRVDRHVAEHVFLGERHEQVARAHDLVHAGQPRDAIGERRHGLGSAGPHHRRDAELVTGRQHMRVVGAKGGRGRDDHDLRHAGHLGRYDRHQERGGIGRRTAGHAHADPAERHVSLPQRAAPGERHRHVAGEHRLLKPFDAFANPPHSRQELGRHGGVGGGQRLRVNQQRLGRHIGPVDSLGVVQQGREPLGPHVFADPRDHLPRRERLAEDVDRPLAARRADHVSLRDEFSTEGVEPLTTVGRGKIDAFTEVRGGRHHDQGYTAPLRRLSAA